jgi:arginyl-tRNA synthetase
MSLKSLIAWYLESKGKSDLVQYLEYPADTTMADVALPCFMLAKQRQQSPAQIAMELAQELVPDDHVARIQAVGPYVNFFINWTSQAGSLFDTMGVPAQKDEHIVIESPWPNTNKPLHLGHVRNMLLGNALANILQTAWYQVTKVDIINDRGVHICKSMLAYQQLGNNAEPTKKSDHYVGDWYVAYDKGLQEHPEREQDIQTMLVQREQGDHEIRALWNKMNQWCIQGHRQTYTRYGTHIDKAYLESDHYLKGKALVEQGLQDGIFTTNEKGNIVIDLTQEMGQEKTVLRADGTAIYMTQDLALAKIRYDDFTMDRMIYVVGNEQEDHFKALFLTLQKLGYSFAHQCHHLSYGMIELPDGKMKSRQWNVVDADNLADQMFATSLEMLQTRYPELDLEECSRRAEIIAMAAIKFYILKYESKKNFVFDREHSLDFAGETGPYVLYTYARIKSILKQCSWLDTSSNTSAIYERNDHEHQLLTMLALYWEQIELAAETYSPSVIARYILSLSALFNTYYHSTKILEKDDQWAILPDSLSALLLRLQLLQHTAQVINAWLQLLWIETLETM